MENEKDKDAIIAELTARIVELEYNETQMSQRFHDTAVQLSALTVEKAKLEEAYNSLDNESAVLAREGAILATEANENEKLNHALTARAEGLENRIYQLQRMLDEMSAAKAYADSHVKDLLTAISLRESQIKQLRVQISQLRVTINNGIKTLRGESGS